MGVSGTHEIRINDKIIYGGLTRGPVAVGGGSVIIADKVTTASFPIQVWQTYSLIIGATVLKRNNILKIRSVPRNDGGIDDFVIDNCYVQFKIN